MSATLRRRHTRLLTVLPTSPVEVFLLRQLARLKLEGPAFFL